jgi:hypothetical protein
MVLAYQDLRHGSWPTRRSGPVEGAEGEAWHRIDNALFRGYRGLPGGSSLTRLLRQAGLGD